MNISRLPRERRWLIMRLHNRDYNENIFRKFLEYNQVIEYGQRYISKLRLMSIVGQEFSDLLDLFLKLCMQKSDKIPLEPFISFLRIGLLPKAEEERGYDIHDEAFDSNSFNVNHHDSSGTRALVEESVPELADDVWKKHETVIQERVVIYTSIDRKHGVSHRVKETDKTQMDIIHLENSSGVFAHREYTQQEQTEDLDDEQVTFIRATKEYIHMKRDDDEYEYVHSEIPSTDLIHKDNDSDDDKVSTSSVNGISE